MRVPWSLAAALLASLFTLSEAGADAAVVPSGTVVRETIDSSELRGNLLGESSLRSVSIYLPPGYASHPRRRYPVVYLLHGYTANDRGWTTAPRQTNRVIDQAIASGGVPPMIVVWPDGSNGLLGSFYTNSLTTGNWEQFIAEELVRFIDGRFRTLARPESRGLAGHSMGGYGALKIAMRHPEVFGAVYGMSPCCLGWAADLSLENRGLAAAVKMRSRADFDAHIPAFRIAPYSQAWLDNMYDIAFWSMAAAWSPDPSAPPFHAELPVEAGPHGLVIKEAVRAKWSANMPLAMLDQYLPNLRRLRGIAFDVGTSDAFTHIPITTRELAQRLSARGIPYEFEEYDGHHSDRVEARIGTKVLPFFGRTLMTGGRKQ